VAEGSRCGVAEAISEAASLTERVAVLSALRGRANATVVAHGLARKE